MGKSIFSATLKLLALATVELALNPGAIPDDLGQKKHRTFTQETRGCVP